MENSNADMLVGRILNSYIRSERCDLYRVLVYVLGLGKGWDELGNRNV